jgi:hypothetical protein
VGGFLATVHAEVAGLDVSRRALRHFGLAVGGVFAGLAAVAAWRAGDVPGPFGLAFGIVGSVLLIGGVAAPGALARVYRVWMTAAIAMGFVTTRVLLTLTFALVFVPVGLLFRLLRRDVLAQRPDPGAASYWIRHEAGPSARDRLERMY